jgi:hypothetical protein
MMKIVYQHLHNTEQFKDFEFDEVRNPAYKYSKRVVSDYFNNIVLSFYFTIFVSNYEDSDVD